MEPMTLGSPVGSPSSPGSGSAYLPGFLIGESTHSPHPSSPTKTPRQVGGIGTIPVTPRSLNRHNISPACERRSRSVHVNPVEKPGGPPTVGLFDTLDSTSVPSRSTPMTSNINIVHNMQMGMMTPTTPIRNLENSTLIEQCSGNTVSSTFENWVTVFGFPPAAASTIISQFSQLGQLLEHKFPPKGNWVHLRYYSKMEARRAMTYHGKIFGGSTMIGVMPCRDPSIMKSCSTGLESPQVVKLPNRIVSPLSNVSNLWTPDNSIIHSPRARSLSRAPCYTENEVLSAHNTPVRNTGLFSRTIDYIFGW